MMIKSSTTPILRHGRFISYDVPCKLLTGLRLQQFYNNRAFECDTLSQAMEFFGIDDLKQSICPWISKQVTLHAHQLVDVH